MKSIILSVFFALSVSAFAQVEYKPKQPASTNPTSQNENIKPEKKIRTEPPKQNIIKINLLSPIFSTIMMFYQHNIKREGSLQIGLGYMDFYGFGSSSSTNYNSNNYFTTTTTNEHTRGFFITPEYRYLFSGENMEGFFIAPFLKYSYIEYNETVKQEYSSSNYPYTPIPTQITKTSYNYNTLGVGITVGKQLIFRNRISLEIFAGPVFNILLNNISTDIKVSPTMSNIIVRGYGARAGMTVGFLF